MGVQRRGGGERREREKGRRGNGRVDSSAFVRCISPSVFPGGAEETAKTLAYSVFVLRSDKGLEGSRGARK